MKLVSAALIVLGALVLTVTAIATIREVRTGVITRRPFSQSSGAVASREDDPRAFWINITRRTVGVGVIGGGLIVLDWFLPRTKSRRV